VDQKSRRAAVAKAMRAHKVGLSKGHWKLIAGQITWWVDLRAASPAPDAAMGFEVGAWVKGAGPTPDGGAVDCPLLCDVALGPDPTAQTSRLIGQLGAIDSLPALAAALEAGELRGAQVDASLRTLLSD
jgi:hypothetical protein